MRSSGRNKLQGTINQTSIEIYGQPKLWRDSYEKITNQQNEIKAFLNKVLRHQDLQIILTGAGTSAFIGESLTGTFQRTMGRTTTAIPTTHLVTHPAFFLQKDRPTLMVSFARSGNSPESTAAVMLANSFCKDVYHLIITCNPTGNLANCINGDNVYLFILPPAANDQALAMTGSYTSMLLSGVLLARIHQLNELKSQVNNLSCFGDNILQNQVKRLQEIAHINFKRAVFLGSGPLFGSAHESHLKLQELTDGQVICKFDSFLGIRHGPKAVINEDTLMVYLLSNSPYVRRYEIDLIDEISREGRALISLGVCQKALAAYKVDQLIELSPDQTEIDEELLAICAVLPSQILGYYKSVQLGLNPDQPSVSGTISRVVSGVGIYNYNEH